MNSRCTSVRQRRLQRVDVEGDDRALAGGRQPCDEAVADLAAGAGNEDNRFANHVSRSFYVRGAGLLEARADLPVPWRDDERDLDRRPGHAGEPHDRLRVIGVEIAER